MSNFNDDALLNGQFALQKIDDLLNRVDGVVNRWPRLYKNSYGERLYKLLADMEELCITAAKKYHKKTTLQELDIKNAQVHIHIRRIAKTSFTDKRGEKRGLITPGQHSYGCRKNKGTLSAARCLLNWVQLISRKPDARDWMLIKCDVSKYFYRVDHKIALDVYRDYTDDEWFLRLMSVILNNPDVTLDCRREPARTTARRRIGNLTSQETANIYL